MPAYRPLTIHESHMHIWREIPLEESLDFFRRTRADFGYETIALLALEDHWRPDPYRALQQNLKTAYYLPNTKFVEEI